MLFLDPLRQLAKGRSAARAPAKRHSTPALKPTTYYVPVVSLAAACPECTGPLMRASACVSCAYCGWSKCG